MDWTVLTSPVAGLLGVLVGAGISSRTQRSTHREKLAADRELAERKTNADIALAEQKFAFDKAIVSWRRQYELAEQLLTTVYDTRDALNWARVRAIFSGEGKSRQATEPETEQLRHRRDIAFVPLERLHASAKTFATLQALKYTAAAHFGPEAITPIDRIMEVHHSISAAAALLLEMTWADDDQSANQSLIPMRKALWGDRPDENDKKVDAAIQQLETICQPILAAKAPT